VYLVRIKEQAGENGSTVSMHRNVVCLFKNKFRCSNFKFCYTDDVRLPKNLRLLILLITFIPNELEIKETTDRDRSASYFDLHLEIDVRTD
jgi:hypothetical protein